MTWSLGIRSKCMQLFGIYRFNLRGVSEMTACVCSALMYCTCEAWSDSISHDIGQIMCYSSQQSTLFGAVTFLNVFQGNKEAEHVKHTKINVVTDKMSTCAGHICAIVLWNKPSSVWLSSFSHIWLQCSVLVTMVCFVLTEFNSLQKALCPLCDQWGNCWYFHTVQRLHKYSLQREVLFGGQPRTLRMAFKMTEFHWGGMSFSSK